MNKKMIALAVAAAMPMAANAADVTVFGKAQIQLVDRSSDNAAAEGRGLEDGTNSRFGFKLSEDLGNGLKAVGKINYRIDMADGAANAHPIASREHEVGLKGAFGTLTFGRHAGVYKGTNLDPYIATALQARNGGGQSTGAFGHNGFISDTIKYSNKFGPVKFSALISANDSDATSGDHQIAVDYKGGPLRVLVALSNNEPAAGDSEERTKFGVQYKMGGLKLTAQMESVDNYNEDVSSLFGAPAGTIPSGVGLTGDFMMLQADYTMGSNTFSLRVGSEEYELAGVPGSGTNDVTMLAVRHKFSKKTSVFGGMIDKDGEGFGSGAVALGMLVNF